MTHKTQAHQAIREHCRSHLSSIIGEGLKPFPSCVFDAEVLLNAAIVDLEKVNEVLRSDIRFGRRVLRLSNEILTRSNDSAQSIPDAVVLLGPCLFQAVLLLCAVSQCGANGSPDENAKWLWSHSLQMALVSETIAQQSDYPHRGVAFAAGLLHDIGYLPLLVVARRQEVRFSELAGVSWRDDIELERDIFGLDHCQVGRWMAKSWKLSQSLVDVVTHHHDPRRAEIDSQLAEIIYAAETHCSPSAEAVALH